jgi:glycosyltransferase involved in cell wall biosynthesis
MLIGVDASRAIAPHPTGTETYSRRLIQALLALESPHRFRLYFRTKPPTDAFPGADLRPIPFPRLWTHLRLSWEMALHAPDALFVPSHVLPLIHPKISFVTVHDLGYRYFPEAHPWPQRLYLELSTRWNARAATHLLADSEATKRDLIKHYQTPSEKIAVAYPGVDSALAPVRDPSAIQAVRTRYGIGPAYFFYLGTLQPRKNLARLIEAFSQFLARHPESAMELVLAGKRGWLYHDLFEQVRRRGMEPRVHFPGYVAAEDKAALLSGAQAFTFPSLYEGFGLPVLEAQACGCPVITSTTSSLPEVAGDGALLVAPRDAGAIAKAMIQVATSPELRRTLVQRGYANVDRFSWKVCARTVLNAIERASVGHLESMV